MSMVEVTSDDVAIPDSQRGKVELKATNGKTITAEMLGQVRFAKYTKIVMCPEYSFEALQWLKEEILCAVANDWDQVILVTGEEGCGKSSLALHLAYLLDPNFSLDNVTFTEQEFKDWVRNCKPGSVGIMDEAGEAMFAYEWMERGQRDLIKAFFAFRAKNLIIILVMPHAKILTKQLRERRVGWWLNTYAKSMIMRGYSHLRKRPQIGNPWEIDTFWEGVCGIRFPSFADMYPEVWKAYDKRKNDFIERTLEFTGRPAKEGLATVKMRETLQKSVPCLLNKGWTLYEIAKMYRLSVNTIRGWNKIATV